MMWQVIVSAFLGSVLGFFFGIVCITLVAGNRSMVDEMNVENEKDDAHEE